MRDRHQEIGRSLALGAVSGLRSMSGPASIARAARDGGLSLEGTRLSFLASPRVAAALTVLQAGEMVGDKTPFIPGRTAPGPLLGRAASGALAGAAVSGGSRSTTGALFGAGAAVAAAFAGENLRAFAAGRTGVPDPLLGVVEDGVVLVLGSLLAGRGRPWGI